MPSGIGPDDGPDASDWLEVGTYRDAKDKLRFVIYGGLLGQRTFWHLLKSQPLEAPIPIRATKATNHTGKNVAFIKDRENRFTLKGDEFRMHFSDDDIDRMIEGLEDSSEDQKGHYYLDQMGSTEVFDVTVDINQYAKGSFAPRRHGC